MMGYSSRDYFSITEQRSGRATREQLERLYHRYRLAATFAEEKDVLEVGCGCGFGLGYLARRANKVVGGDIDEKNIASASNYYKGREDIEILKLDAHELPFSNNSFDLVVLFESIYYLENPDKFIAEARRVLRDDGILIVCTVNPLWEDFHPSKYSVYYYSAKELYEMLERHFGLVELYGAFYVGKKGIKDKITSALKRMASKLNLIPGSLRARELLKRVFIGELSPMPNEVYEDMAIYHEPKPIIKGYLCKDFKIIYAVARK